MRLTKIVPALALVAAVAAPSMAVELADGTLTLSGDVTFEAASRQQDDGTNTRTDTDFYHDLDFKVAYRVGDDVEAMFHIEEDNGQAGAINKGIRLEEAYITWAFAPNLSLTVGKYDNWLWDVDVAIDSDLTDSLTGNQATGFNLGYAYEIDGESSIDLFAHLVEDIYTAEARPTSKLAAAVGATYSNSAFGLVGGSVNVDVNDGKDNNNLGINVYAEIDMVQDFVFGAAISYVDFDKAAAGATETQFGVGAYATYTAIPTSFPSSASLQVSMLDTAVGSYAVAAPTNNADTTDIKIQAVYWTKPTSNDNFMVGAEINYTDMESDTEGGKDTSELAFLLQFVAKIP